MKTKIPTLISYLSKGSLYLKFGFLVKILLFLSLSTIALISKSYLLNFALALGVFLMILSAGGIKNLKKPIKYIFLAIPIFLFFWVFLSKVAGNTIYFQFPWGTFISDNTLRFVFWAVSKWVLITFSGLFFMQTTTEDELINFLYSIKLPEKAILSTTIAFNTIAFSLKDVNIAEYALVSRNFKSDTLSKKIKKIYLIGNTLLLNNIKRIENLGQSYFFRVND